jgi:spermidine/putrescine transport system ATP-binding protein
LTTQTCPDSIAPRRKLDQEIEVVLDSSVNQAQTKSAEAAVAVRSVTKHFDSVVALKNVSIDIVRGEFFSLLGPSGCGKTTLLRMIGGFEEPTSGEIFIGGRNVVGDPPYARTTNMIFQNLALFPHLSVSENIAFGLRLRRSPNDEITRRVEEALALVRLEGYGGRSIDQLSGGQRQRVAMARALINDPLVLLLDEPLGALDLQLRIQMQEELRRLQRELGNTFVFVTHDQGEAMSMSDRIAVMNEGEVVQVGTPEDIYERPANRFVASFVGHANLLDGRVAAANGAMAVVDSGGLSFNVEADGLSPGQPVALAIRFERLRLASAQQGKITGIVKDRTFLGGQLRLVVVPEKGPTLTVDATTGGGAKLPLVGDRVYLDLQPSDARVLLA